MRRATGGVNTHKGAIFSLGIAVRRWAWVTARRSACTKRWRAAAR